jgi:hypothetical protein
MFVVSEAEATAIRTAFDQGGEFAAAVELRRLFPGVADNAQARARLCGCWGNPTPIYPLGARERGAERGPMWWFLAGAGVVTAACFFVVRATVHAIIATGTDTLG